MGRDRRRHEFQDESTILNWDWEKMSGARARMKDNIISMLETWRYFE